MNPEQQLPPPPGTPYDFIVNPSRPPKPTKGVSLGGNNGFLLKIGVGVGAVFVLMIIAAVVVNMLTGNKTNTADIVTIAQTQQEIVRVSTLGKIATDQNIRNAAMSTELVVTTQQQGVLTFLSQHKRTVKEKELSQKKNASTDKQLTTATQTSTFDTVFEQITRGQLEDYAAALKDAHDNATNIAERQLLSNDYAQTQVLIKQWP